MGLFNFFRKKRRDAFYKDVEEDLKYGGEGQVSSTKLGHDAIDRCEQILELSKEVEEERGEYKVVTSYLQDIEKLQNLPPEEKKALQTTAESVKALSGSREKFLKAEKKISDTQFMQMQQEEREMPEIILRLQSNEKYLDTLERDLRYLNQEKTQWEFYKEDAKEMMEKIQLALKVILSLAILVTVVLLVLQMEIRFSFREVLLGIYFVLVVVAFFLYIKNQNLTTEVKQCDANLNRAIVLENKVKIKYVNTKNAVDYTREKYHAKNAKDLEKTWGYYLEALKEREDFIRTNEDLEYYTEKLMRQLAPLHLYDSRVWQVQAQALADPREMVEIKHDLITRRQKLRDMMQSHLELIQKERVEIEALIAQNPEGKQEILDIVSSIDKLVAL